MADFCQQCSIKIFGEDFGELANPGQPPLAPGMVYFALCEECGPIYTDAEGKCICDCYKHHYVEPKNDETNAGSESRSGESEVPDSSPTEV